MAFTDKSDLFGSVHEDGIDLVTRHLMRQRPSLFNYATPAFHDRPDLFCERIEVAKSVLDAGNPLFTEQAPLPILAAPVPLGINFCLQLTDVQIDFHPGNLIQLPPELGELKEQRFALRARACAGIDCPSKELIDELLPSIERFLVAQRLESLELKEGRDADGTRRAGEARANRETLGHPELGSWTSDRQAMTAQFGTAVTHVPPRGVVQLPPRGVFVLPTRSLECFCLEVHMVGHVEWGPVAGSQQQWLKARLDGVEIVDLQPEKMENALECYVSTVLRLGILPRVMVPMETLILDVTAVLEKQGLQVGKQVTLGPSAVPGDVPNNPAIEDDLLKAFIKLSVTDVGP